MKRESRKEGYRETRMELEGIVTWSLYRGFFGGTGF